MDLIKSIWPEWEIVKLLGRGSFGTVYEAVRKEHNLESRAAIKVITIPQNESEIDSLKSEGMSLDASRTYLQNVVEDFVEEIRLMESFKGVQNIVSVEDYKVVEKTDEIGWDIYIRMELLTPFTNYAADRTLTEEEVIKLGCDICTALELCDKRDIIHRDIKPENIFVNSFGDFKLGDFGIARKLENTTGGLSQKGTYNYMAPEVKQGTHYDSSVDQYSLGLVLYRFSNKNRLPFLNNEKQLLSPNDRMEAINRRMSGEELPSPCDASVELADVILKACSFDPGNRFSSITEMKKALTEVAEGSYTVHKENETVAVRKPEETDETVSVRNIFEKQETETSNRYSGKKSSKKSFILVAIVVLLILCCVGIYRLLPQKDKEDNENIVAEEINGESVTEIAKDVEDGQEKQEEQEEVASDSEEVQIAEIIENAEKIAGNEDFDSALSMIEDGLISFPDSISLQDKKVEYEDRILKKEKESVLGQADDLAQKGDYESAINVITEAQEKNAEDPDYKKTYQLYISAYIKNVIGEADTLAGDKKYAEAVEKVKNAVLVTGENAALSAKEKEYEGKYVFEVLSEADVFISSQEYDKAEAALNEAIRLYPDNEELNNKLTLVKSSKPEYLLIACPPYQTDKFYTEKTYSLAGDSYTNGFNLKKEWGVPGIAYFNLGGKYKSLSFDVGHIDGRDLETGYYYIYLDNELVCTLTLDPSMLVEHKEIALNGAKQMVIEGGDWSQCYA
nr:protein kinase [Treponemataceae bacterium]